MSVFSGGQFYDTGRTFLVRALVNWASNCPEDMAETLGSISTAGAAAPAAA
jgi:hypothetical protein